MSDLPRPVFADNDPAAIVGELVATMEAALGRPLQAAQPERALVDVQAYRESLMRAALQHVGEQALVRFAEFPMLDHLGEFHGVSRLPGAPALTTLRFTLASAQAFPVVVPTGTRVATADEAATFATTAPCVIAASATQGDVAAAATVDGVFANGYAAGQVATILDPIPHVASAANLTTTADGADIESTEALRARVLAAPEGYSVAGPAGAYKHFARAASAAVTDVAVACPGAGVIQVYILTAAGVPSEELIDLVQAALSAEDVRPLSDEVQVLAPEAVPFAVALGVWVDASAADPATIVEAARLAALAKATQAGARLGLAIVPEAILAAAQAVPGVHRVTLAEALAYQALEPGEWAQCTGVTAELAGVA